MGNIKKAFILILFWMHVFLVLFWIGLFFVPTSIWSGKIIFHFRYLLVVVGVQLLWGFFYFPITRKFSLICPITTLMQLARGYSLKNKKNYGHSFVSELFEKIKIKLSYKSVNILIIITLIIVIVQYIWFN